MKCPVSAPVKQIWLDRTKEDYRLFVIREGAMMRPIADESKVPAAKAVEDFRRTTRKRHSAEEKIRIVHDELSAGVNIGGILSHRPCPFRVTSGSR